LLRRPHNVDCKLCISPLARTSVIQITSHHCKVFMNKLPLSWGQSGHFFWAFIGSDAIFSRKINCFSLLSPFLPFTYLSVIPSYLSPYDSEGYNMSCYLGSV
jgi:hypothetical protein